jgi:hypothetical protein
MATRSNRESKHWAQYVEEMLALDKFVNDELAEARELVRFTTYDFAVRTFVRTMAAEFETRLYLLQDFMLKVHEESANLKFEAAEEAILQSETYSLRKNGVIERTPKFYPFRDHLLFTLRLFAKRFHPKAMPEASGPGWDAVLKFIQIRNRLMHPKSMADLEISESEIDSINAAQDWLRSAFKALFAFESLKGPPTRAPRAKQGDSFVRTDKADPS